MTIQPDDLSKGILICILQGQSQPHQTIDGDTGMVITTTVENTAYMGACLLVTAVQLPYIVCQVHWGLASPLTEPCITTFDTRTTKFMHCSKEYAQALGLPPRISNKAR